MTFDQFRNLKRGDPWDLSHTPHKVNKPKFVRHKGRVFVVVLEHDGLLHCETLSGHLQRKVLAAHDLDV